MEAFFQLSSSIGRCIMCLYLLETGNCVLGEGTAEQLKVGLQIMIGHLVKLPVLKRVLADKSSEWSRDIGNFQNKQEVDKHPGKDEDLEKIKEYRMYLTMIGGSYLVLVNVCLAIPSSVKSLSGSSEQESPSKETYDREVGDLCLNAVSSLVSLLPFCEFQLSSYIQRNLF